MSTNENTAETVVDETAAAADEFLDAVEEAETQEATEATEEEPTKKPRRKRVNKNPKPYPFRSKKDIVAAVQTSDEACLEGLSILYARQTASEQEKGNTESRNRQGFMSSHAVKGTKLARKAEAGEDLSADELEEARAIVSRYGRQLAAHYRAEAIQADPSLGELAKLFSAN